MAILGGFQTLVGPLVGGVVLVFLQDVGRDVTTYFSALTGLVLVALVYGFPEGIVGWLSAGGSFRTRLRELRDDPAVVGQWVGSARDALADALGRSARNLRVLIFGVN